MGIKLVPFRKVKGTSFYFNIRRYLRQRKIGETDNMKLFVNARKVFLFITLIFWALISSSCSNNPNQIDNRRHDECFRLDRDASDLHTKALKSGNVGKSTLEWKKYELAKARFKDLECGYWFTLSYND